MKTKKMTIVYFINGNNILLPIKKRKHGKGLNNGVGGKVEDHETVVECMLRECIEEVGLVPTKYEHMGHIKINQLFDNERSLCELDIFVCTNYYGKLRETDEMKPEWHKLDKIPYDNMFENDKLFLPIILNNEKINGTFELDDNGKTLKKNIITLNKKRQYKRN